jgi:hypothetical protein
MDASDLVRMERVDALTADGAIVAIRPLIGAVMRL